MYILVHVEHRAGTAAGRSLMDATIGVDVGTSGCKAVALGSDGRVLHTAGASYPTTRRLDGEVTQDPDDWLTAVRSVLRECASAVEGLTVGGLGVTAPAHAAVLSDADGTPLAPCMLAFDARPAAIAEALRARYGPELQAATFVDLSAGWTLAQMAWRREHADTPWTRVRWLLTQKDWIRFRLTGAAFIDATDAAGTAMVDQRSGTWLEPVCRDIGFDAEQLPPIVASTAPAGRLLPEWAAETGLPEGTPVVAGATDTAAELVSVQAVEAGSSLVKIASTGTVVGVSQAPVVDRRLLTYPHAVPGLWYTLAATNTATVAYQWLREVAFAASPAQPAATYEEINRLASGVPAGSEGLLFLPYLSGERTPYFDPLLRAAFLGLSSAHRQAHLARAVLEGVCLALRDCRDVMREAGFDVGRPHLAGGGMSSELWRSILVSALRAPGVLREPQGPAVGAAILAAAAGASTAAEVRARIPAAEHRTIEPIAAWAATYDALHHTYRLAAEAITDVSHRLAGVTGQSQVRA